MRGFYSLLFENTSTRHTVARNSFWRFAALGFYKTIRFFAVVLAARWLGPEVFGSYSYAIAVASIAFIFSEWGVNVLLTRDLQSSSDQNKLFTVALTVKSCVTIVSLIGALIFSLFVDSGITPLIQIVSITFAITNIRELFVAVMIAKGRSELEAATVLVEGVLTALLIGGYFYVTRTPDVFALIALYATIAAVLTSSFLLYRFLHIRIVSIDTSSIYKFFMDGLPLAFFGVLSYAFFTADQLFIEYYLGVEAVGYYSFATRIIYVLLLVPAMLSSVIFPVFAKKIAEGRNIKRLFNQTILSLSALGAVFGIVIFLVRDVAIFFAPQYSSSIPVLVVLGFLLAVIFTSLWLDYVLVTLHKQKQNFFLTLIAAILNVALNFYFVPRYGILGAAYATVISQCINVAVTYVYARSVILKQYVKKA